jgi:hypothetical protein
MSRQLSFHFACRLWGKRAMWVRQYSDRDPLLRLSMHTCNPLVLGPWNLFLRWSLNAFANLKELELFSDQYRCRWWKSGSKSFVAGCSELRLEYLCCEGIMRWSDFMPFLATQRNLVELHVCCIKRGNARAPRASLSLPRLRICGGDAISLPDIIPAAPNLATLHWIDSRPLSPQLYASLLPHMRNLKYLSFETRLRGRSLTPLQFVPHLDSIEGLHWRIRRTKRIRDPAEDFNNMDHSVRSISSRNLKLLQIDGVKDADERAEVTRRWFKTFPHLQTIEFGFAHGSKKGTNILLQRKYDFGLVGLRMDPIFKV